MLFSSVSFLYVFLPAVLLCYALARGRWKNHVLLLFSLLFYAAGEPVYIVLLLFTAAVAVCDVCGWWLVNWFLRTSRYAGINDAAHLVWGLVTLYVASAAAYVLLWNLYRLLANIEDEQVFVPANVHCLRAASWCCMAVALLCLGGAVFYLPMVMVAAAAAFMGLIVRIIKNVFQRAIGMKAELDLTI